MYVIKTDAKINFCSKYLTGPQVKQDESSRMTNKKIGISRRNFNGIVLEKNIMDNSTEK